MSFFTSVLLASAALFNSLDPKSVAEALAFYELYPTTDEGKKALERAKSLLYSSKLKAGEFDKEAAYILESGASDIVREQDTSEDSKCVAKPTLPKLQLSTCLSIDATEQTMQLLPKQINRLKGVSKQLTEEEVAQIEKLAAHLPNRKLKGYSAEKEEDVIALSTEEIDLGKALILSQLGSAFQARSYSAMLDLMALQILARLPKEATPLEKIQETNRFIFEQMHFRFPPQSVYVENIDRYTFLPSVMDNHLGVCLGVTAMYLALAQRIDLPLEIVTPPGHIYVRYRIGEKTLNIETTARGVHMEDETYLSIQNGDLEQRTLKEVIGMTHVNQASTYLYKGEYRKAATAYEKAKPYMPDDPLIKELLGYSYLFCGKQGEGEALLKEVEKGMHSIGEDFLAGKVDLEGMV